MVARSPAEIEHMRLKLRHTLQVHFDYYVHSPDFFLEDIVDDGAGGGAVVQPQQLLFTDSDSWDSPPVHPPPFTPSP